MKRHSLRTLLTMAILTVLAAAMMTGCTRIPRQRTLPPSIRSVSVPMFINRSAEPQIEEDATVYTQEEFLADGRLDLVRPEKADAIIDVTIDDFVEESPYLDSDDLPESTQYTITATVEVKRNVPGMPVIGGARQVIAYGGFNSDKRRVSYEPEPVGKERVLRDFARLIVREVITGEYSAEEYLVPSPLSP
ncbi:hypothetical protein KQI84_01755 [bacterium]|nr:hypothetical protein [bacterium]